MLCSSSALRLPSGRIAAPTSSSASVTVVVQSCSPSCRPSQFVTAAAGAGRMNSDNTLVSRMIISVGGGACAAYLLPAETVLVLREIPETVDHAWGCAAGQEVRRRHIFRRTREAGEPDRGQSLAATPATDG